MCIAALLAGARPILRIVVARGRPGRDTAVLLAADRSPPEPSCWWPSSRTRPSRGARSQRGSAPLIGPNLAWYEDFLRYYYLFVPTVDGSLARRFAFLRCCCACSRRCSMLLRRKAQVPGTATGPSWRSDRRRVRHDVLHDVQPHQVDPPLRCVRGYRRLPRGAHRGRGVGVARCGRERNRAIFAGRAVLFMLAVAFSGINGYWYVSSYGVPWFDKPSPDGGQVEHRLAGPVRALGPGAGRLAVPA